MVVKEVIIRCAGHGSCDLSDLRRLQSLHSAWVNAYKSDRLIHCAWDKCSFVKDAKKIADIRLTHLPYQERLEDMPQSDLDAEGGLWKSLDEFINLFGSPERVVWVVRFELTLPPREQSSANELLVQNLDNWNQPVVVQ